MIQNLHDLDRKLWMQINIEICGASAAILNNALKRSSYDIDVIYSSFPLADPRMRKILDEIDKSPNQRESWLNDRCREDIKKRFPEAFKFDKERIVGEQFLRLHPTVISKADFILCKLAIDPAERRNHDLLDVKNIVLDQTDVQRFFEKLQVISQYKQGMALKVEGLFKQLRSEYVFTLDDLPYTNVNEIIDYCRQRYGMKPNKATIDEWRDDINNINKRPATIVGMIDYNIGMEIESGNNRYAERDIKYRLSKEIDNGFEL